MMIKWQQANLLRLKICFILSSAFALTCLSLLIYFITFLILIPYVLRVHAMYHSKAIVSS